MNAHVMATMPPLAMKQRAPPMPPTMLEPLAALKVLLHAAKHPHAAVCGILLGPKQDAAAVDDAVPLFHHTTLSPLLETAFLLVEQHAAQAGKRLAGYYYAPAEAVGDEEGVEKLPAQVLAAAAQMRAHYPGALLIKVNNKKLADKKALPFEAYEQRGSGGDGGEWAVVGSGGFQVSPEGPAAFDRVYGGAESGGGKAALEACRGLVDMDEHLDDARRDFRNPQVAQLLQR